MVPMSCFCWVMVCLTAKETFKMIPGCPILLNIVGLNCCMISNHLMNAQLPGFLKKCTGCCSKAIRGLDSHHFVLRAMRPMRAQPSTLMSQVGSNLRFSQLHPLRPSYTDQLEYSFQTICVKQVLICDSLICTISPCIIRL